MTIREFLEKHKADSRFRAVPAEVGINAPLALIQTSLEAQHALIEEALKCD